MKAMKRYREKLLVMAVAVMGFSCADDNLRPILTVDQLMLLLGLINLAVLLIELDQFLTVDQLNLLVYINAFSKAN